MADPKLEQLKSKYKPALDKLQVLHVQLQNLHLQDDKLVLRGHAKTKGDSNLVWEEIKKVDSNYARDLMAQITYESEGPPSTGARPATTPLSTASEASAPQPAAKGPTPQAASSAQKTTGAGRTYTVKAGDTLSKIAKQFYGDASLHRRIFEANRDQLSDPDKIQPGQMLRVPE